MKKTIGLLAACILVVFNGFSVYGAVYTDSLLNYPGIKVVESTDAISSQYSFMPNLENSTSEIIGTGSQMPDGKSYLFFFAEIAKGTAGVRYHNVGSYKGIELDMKVIMADWEEDALLIQLSKNDMGIYISAESGIKLTYTYLQAGTDIPVAVAGYHSFSEIDDLQYIRIHNDMNVHQMYCTPNNVLQYVAGEDYLQVGEVNEILVDEKDQSVWLNYTYDETSSFSITFGATGNSIFRYTYEMILPVTKPVNVRYIDASGAEIAPSDILDGAFGDTYQAVPKIIDGYTLETMPSNANGTLSEEEQTVIFVYKITPTDIPVEKGSVQVLYLDENQKELAQPDTVTGTVGEAYTTAPKEIDGYILTQEPENMTGTFTAQEQTVIFIYQKIPEKTKVQEITPTATPRTTESTTPSVTRKAAVKTGDSSRGMMLYGILSFASLAVVLVFRKKYKRG